MEDKRTALAIFLSIIVIIVYSELFLPKPATIPATSSSPQQISEQQNVKNGPQSQLPVQTSTNVTLPTGSTAAPTLITPSRDQYLDGPWFAVETNLYKARFSFLGGRLLGFRLKHHAAELKTKRRLNLVSVNDNNFPLGVSANGFSDAGIQYQILEGAVSGQAQLEDNTYRLSGNENFTVLLTGQTVNGTKITKQLTFRPDSYLLDFNVALESPLPSRSPVWIEWIEHIPTNLESLRWNPKFYEILEGSAGVTRISIADQFGSKELTSRWAGIGDSYFAFLILGQNSGQATFLSQIGEIHSVKMRGSDIAAGFQLFAGPKNYEMLSELGHDLYKAVDLGYFAFVGEPILIAVHFLYDLLGNYGLAIVLLTLIIKALLLPLTKTSFKSMKAMQDLQPEMQELRSRIKDPNQLNKEIMGLYQKRGVNPLGGCLPILLQMPIFLGMYNALQRSIDLRHADFALWINDLSAPEGLEMFGIKVPVMILLMGGSMLWQQVTTPTTGDPAQKRIMYIIPFVFTIMFVIYPFPSGLVLYWLINNIISIVQQMSLRSAENANPLRATIIGSVITFVGAYLLTLL